MQIKYVGGSEEVTIRDIRDSRFAHWKMGEVKDVPNEEIAVLDAYGAGDQRNAVEAVLNAGFNFVDAATGKNPLFTCAGCGGRADHDSFRPHELRDPVAYRDDEDRPLCVPCFLARRPEHEKWHADRGLARGTLQLAADRRSALAPAASPAPIPAPVVTAAHVAEDEE